MRVNHCYMVHSSCLLNTRQTLFRVEYHVLDIPICVTHLPSAPPPLSEPVCTPGASGGMWAGDPCASWLASATLADVSPRALAHRFFTISQVLGLDGSPKISENHNSTKFN
jgi:hypothetical protein